MHSRFRLAAATLLGLALGPAAQAQDTDCASQISAFESTAKDALTFAQVKRDLLACLMGDDLSFVEQQALRNGYEPDLALVYWPNRHSSTQGLALLTANILDTETPEHTPPAYVGDIRLSASLKPDAVTGLVPREPLVLTLEYTWTDGGTSGTGYPDLGGNVVITQPGTFGTSGSPGPTTTYACVGDCGQIFPWDLQQGDLGDDDLEAYWLKNPQWTTIDYWSMVNLGLYGDFSARGEVMRIMKQGLQTDTVSAIEQAAISAAHAKVAQYSDKPFLVEVTKPAPGLAASSWTTQAIAISDLNAATLQAFDSTATGQAGGGPIILTLPENNRIVGDAATLGRIMTGN